MAILFAGALTLTHVSRAVDFNRDVRPILSENCFACHGPDEGKRKANLRLDEREPALAALKSEGFAIVPGDPAKSKLIERITSTDPDEVMPPPKGGKKLSAEQIATLQKWIGSGAPWDVHWAFRPIATPNVPALPEKHPIDAFIRERLQKENLAPNKQASKETLIRRVSLDLTGLPPTLDEIDAFLGDKSAGAYEKVVDRLLSSQHYGEHMARYWLDAVRYADSHGYHLDTPRSIWAYRDWVIDAFNRNVPFDQFSVAQIAGDMLPSASQADLIASGYNRCNLSSNEGGAIDEEYQAKYTFDRVETTATVWLGITLTCARCHTHKFDPITHKEYYQLYSFFNNFDIPVMDQNIPNSPPTISLPTPTQTNRIARLKREIAAAETNLFAANAKLDDEQKRWENQWRLRLRHGWTATEEVEGSPWQVVGPLKLTGLKNGYETAYDPERKIDLQQSFDGAFETLKWQQRNDFKDGRDNYLVTEVYSIKGNGVFYLNRSVTLREAQSINIQLRGDDLLKLWLNGKIIAERPRPERAGDGPLKIKARFNEGTNSILLKVVNYEAKPSSFNFNLETSSNNLPTEIESLLLSDKELKFDQKRSLTRYFREQQSNDYKKLLRHFDAFKYELAVTEKEVATTMVAKELAKPRETFLLVRGEYDKRGEKALPGVPSILPAFPREAPLNRLGFAQWLFAPEHPLTARVTVNRFWQQVFGVGLVKTAEDFGVQGEAPSHPELLDWLAADFRANSWDVKKLMRRIVTSETYRQSAETTPENFARDPTNRLLARGPRFRTDAEVLRDIVLATSGLLSKKIGGPSAKPYEPPGLWEAVSHENRLRYVIDDGEGRHRRSLYTFWKRQGPPPNMLIFDAPTRESCVVRRGRTTTPLQALALLNDPQYVEAAEAFAKRINDEGPISLKARMRFAFRQATSRWPNPDEEAVMRRALENPRDQNAWTHLASMLLNLDETITKN